MKCFNCGNKFLARTATHRFCSKHCQSATYRDKLKTYICSVEGCKANVNYFGGQLCSFHYRLYQQNLPDRARHIRADGEGTLDKKGYLVSRLNGKYESVHRRIVERILGKKLPPKAQIHHLNEKTWDNRNTNLVVCPNEAYHKLLHQRAKERGITFE